MLRISCGERVNLSVHTFSFFFFENVVNFRCLRTILANLIFHLFLNVNQLDALNFVISLFQASTCFEHMCSSSGGQKLYYTVSGIITLKQVNGPIGGRPVHRLIFHVPRN